MATKSNGVAKINANLSECWSANRFGVNSPKTNERYAIRTVAEMNATVSAALSVNPQETKVGEKIGTILEAPKPADKNPIRVTPT